MWDGSFCPARLSATIWHLDREFVVETLNHHLPPPVCCLHLSAAAADTPIINTLISSHFEWMWSILVFLSPSCTSSNKVFTAIIKVFKIHMTEKYDAVNLAEGGEWTANRKWEEPAFKPVAHLTKHTCSQSHR